MNILHSAILLSLFIAVTYSDTFNCGQRTLLSNSTGTLHIDRKESDCEFLSAVNTSFFVIKTNDLLLRLGDSITVTSEAAVPGEPVIYKAPIRSGYYIIDVQDPKLLFHFNITDGTSMEAQFIQSSTKDPLTINGDVVSSFNILASKSTTTLDLLFKKTLVDPLLVTISNAKFADSGLRYKLIENDGVHLNIVLEDKKMASLTVEPLATGNCSGSIVDSEDSSHDLVGLPDVPTAAYKCVYLFKNTAASKSSHYDVNFKDFLGLTDSQDQLIIESETTGDSVTISRQSANYAKQIRSFQSRELAVIYSSPGPVQPTKIPFKLTVESKSYGGVVEPASSKFNPLVFPPKGTVRFVVHPQYQEYAGIEVLSTKNKLQDMSVKISSVSETLAKFSGNLKLPNLIVANKPSEDLVLEFSGNDLSWLKINASSYTKSCNKIGESVGRLSIMGAQECVWILTPSELTGLEVKKFVNSCLTIQPLDQEAPVYDKCVTSLNETLPVFNLETAALKVTLQNEKSTFDASLVASSSLELKKSVSQTSFNVSTFGYPLSNIWSSKNEVLQIDARNKSYVLTVADADVRDNEKVYFNSIKLKTGDEMQLFNTSANITVVRTTTAKDFGFHRGIKLVATQFDRILNTSVSTKTLKTPKNVTTFYLRISAPGNRIRYNVSSTDSKLFNVSVFDGTTILRKSSSNLNGSSTAETLILTFRSTKPNATLPELTVNFESIARNKTDYVCDNNSRSVPLNLLCQGRQLCDDGKDLEVSCSSAGPVNPPKVIETGVASFTVFILCVLMLILGASAALYGPDLYKVLDSRFRNGQYTSFTSAE